MKYIQANYTTNYSVNRNKTIHSTGAYTRVGFMWAGAPGLGYAGSLPGAPPQDPMGSPSAVIFRCLLPCSVLRLVPGFSGRLKQFYKEPADD
jgi:hypothetical protein